ncbi:PopZ family protein [Enterovirga rhinocerotis]|uniref:Cell pole-organizing protein PopZ n=1 Tax=Enterovirga rhinocerotis TaxID=1339210 RepID=A0A4R7C5Z1_9HYPH|nr:DUF2497 domain-containing protein [Enterovirga rhinocerotis]TDR93818.1 hypothetical protein EV668_1087 [Enterovirga rhinocerotis]
MSAAPAKTADPSMEEILASIRRIIADDDEVRPAMNATESNGAAVPERIGAADDDEVLDLAETPDAKPAARASLDIEVPDIQFETSPAGPADAEPVIVPPPPEASRESEPSPAPAAQRPALASAAPQAAPPPAAEDLMSAEAKNSVGQAFNLLSHTILSQNATTLEDLVREMLRPMLKTWLDDNLPPLVERLVAAEIERVARGRR